MIETPTGGLLSSIVSMMALKSKSTQHRLHTTLIESGHQEDDSCETTAFHLSIWQIAGKECYIQCRSKVIHPIIACTQVHTRIHVQVSGNCC